MKKSVYVLAFLSCFLISTAVLFKIMHWPSASIILVTGVALLNFGFLPAFFYQRYKAA